MLLIFRKNTAGGNHKCPADPLRLKLKGCLALQRFGHDFADHHVPETVVLAFFYRWTATFYPSEAQLSFVGGSIFLKAPLNHDRAGRHGERPMFCSIRSEFMQSEANLLRRFRI